MGENEEKIKKKCQKDYPEFTDGMDRLGRDDLNKNITRYATYREEVELAQKNDEKLNEAKEVVKDLAGPYRDSLKALKLKLQYLYILLQESAEAPSEEETSEEQAAV